MRTRQLPSQGLLRLADFQGGVLSRAQCLDHGLTRHSLARLAAGGWRTVAPGIHVVHGGQPSFVGWCFAGILYAGPGSCVGLRAAAHLHGWTRTPPVVVDVWVPGRRQLAGFGPVRFRRDSLGREPSLRPDCTDRATTALDLCADASVDEMVAWLARASNGGSRHAALRRELARRPRQRNRALLAEMLDEVAEGAESALEVRFVRDVLEAHGLPVGRRQVQTGAGRVDLVDEEHGLAYELDGRLGHEGTGAFRDARRDNRNLVRGLATLRYGWADTVGRACATARQAAAVLRQRGWAGKLVRCPHCVAYRVDGDLEP